MLYDEIADPESTTPRELRTAYEAELADVVETVGVETAAEDTGVDADRLAALVAGESPEFTVEEAAAVLALSEAYPDAEGVVLELRDHLMLEMSSAVLDVEAVEVGVDADLDARQIQQKIEGRAPMTLDEYARIHHFVASEKTF